MKNGKAFTGMNVLMQQIADPGARAAIEAMLPQLLIVLTQRLGGTIEVPAAEIDATGDVVLMMKLDAPSRTFTFTVERKRK